MLIFAHAISLMLWIVRTGFPANIYPFKVNNRNIRKKCEICSKLTIKTPKQHQWRLSKVSFNGVFLVNFEYILHLNIYYTFSSISFVKFKQVNVCRVCSFVPRLINYFYCQIRWARSFFLLSYNAAISGLK